jgi:integrase
LKPDGSRKTEVAEGDTNTLASRRTLVLSPRVIEAILRHRDNIDHPACRDGAAWVFSTKHGTVQPPGTVERMLHRVLEAHNIRRIRIHNIRHTAVVLAIESGPPIEPVSQGAGHTRLDTTESIYARYTQTLATTFSKNVANYLSVNPIDDQLQELLTQEATLPPGLQWGWGQTLRGSG